MSKAGGACMVHLQEATVRASSTQLAPRKAGLLVPSSLPEVNVQKPGSFPSLATLTLAVADRQSKPGHCQGHLS